MSAATSPWSSYDSSMDIFRTVPLHVAGHESTFQDMNAITREEHDAKLEAWAARMDARFSSIDTKLDVVITKSDMALEAARHAATSADDAKRAASTTKWNILFTGVAVAGVLVALYAFWVSALSAAASYLAH